jgi:hypothetical protein
VDGNPHYRPYRPDGSAKLRPTEARSEAGSKFPDCCRIRSAPFDHWNWPRASSNSSNRGERGMPRRHSSAEALIKMLPAYPIVTLATATQLLGRSKQAANEAIAALARAEVLSPTTLARRNRAWEARELFELVNATEREVATPKRGSASSRPLPELPGATLRWIDARRSMPARRSARAFMSGARTDVARRSSSRGLERVRQPRRAPRGESVTAVSLVQTSATPSSCRPGGSPTLNNPRNRLELSFRRQLA